jgi:hypothetical protein
MLSVFPILSINEGGYLNRRMKATEWIEFGWMKRNSPKGLEFVTNKPSLSHQNAPRMVVYPE